MTINAITSVAPLLPAASAQLAAAQKPQADPTPKAPFEPAPALRPTIQDKIEIDQALLTLRQL